MLWDVHIIPLLKYLSKKIIPQITVFSLMYNNDNYFYYKV